MPRPRKLRMIQGSAQIRYYKPQGIPLSDLVETALPLDGLEALRLADAEGLEQVDAAQRMGISRSTFSRLLAEARSAVATALSQGWALRIGGGPVESSAETLGQGQCTRRRARCRLDTRPATMTAADSGQDNGAAVNWIAVSATGTTPDADVDPRFGRAEWFVLFDPNTRRFSQISNHDAQAQAQGAGLAAVERLSKARVVKVVTGSIGPKAARALSAAGIASVEGADGKTVRQALGLESTVA